MKTHIFMGIGFVVGLLFPDLSSSLTDGYRTGGYIHAERSYTFVAAAYAADEQGERSPYGGSKAGMYGEKREIKTSADAQKILKDYFSKRDVRIKEIKEKELYFEAEILDKNGTLIDKVIIDKRTGRIRSIY